MSDGERLFTSSLDKMIKVFNCENYQLTHQFKFAAAVNSFDLTNENTHLAVGMADGSVVIKKKNTNIEIEEEKEDDGYKMPSFLTYFFFNLKVSLLFFKRFDQKKRIRNYAYFYRGIYKTPEDFDIKLTQAKSLKLTHIENFLKKFQYKQALVSALNTKKNEIIVSLIEELLQRGVLNLVIRKLNGEELKLFMAFIEKHMIVGKFQDTLIETMNKVLDERNARDWENFDGIGRILEEEIGIQKEIEEVCGGLETIANCQGV